MGERSDLRERSQLIEGLAGSPALVERLQQLLDRLDALPPALRGLIRAAAESRLDGELLEFLADYLDEHGLADGRRVRLLRPQQGDVLAVWGGWANPLAAQEAAGALAMFAAVLDLSPGQDLATAAPEQLRAAGWVRAEELTRHGEAVRERCARAAERVARETPGADLDNYVAIHVRAVPAGPDAGPTSGGG
jgi:hypothetical protein